MRPILLLVLSLHWISALLLEQSVAVTGSLNCNGLPAKDVIVKLYDVNTFPIVNFLDEQLTNSTGGFYLSGKERPISTIDPKLNIYHKCNYNGICYKKMSIRIPHDYVSSYSMPTTVFNTGNIELDSGEPANCIGSIGVGDGRPRDEPYWGPENSRRQPHWAGERRQDGRRQGGWRE